MSDLDTQLKTTFDEQVAAGVKDKTTIAIAMHTATNCGINVAIAAYNKFGKVAGIVLTNEERTAKIGDALAAFNTEEGFDRTEALAGLMADFGMTKNTATNHIRSYCAANSIELPKAVTSKVDPKVLDALLTDQHAAGKTRAEIVDMIVKDHGYSENTANSHYLKSAKRLGMVTERDNDKRDKIVAYFVANGAQYSRKEMIAGLQEHFGLAEATAGMAYGKYQFAKSFHAQMTGTQAPEAVAPAEEAAA